MKTDLLFIKEGLNINLRFRPSSMCDTVTSGYGVTALHVGIR